MKRILSSKEAQEQLSKLFPQLETHSVDYLGQGLGNFAFIVNGEWLFRFSKQEVSATFQEEVELLKLLQGRFNFAVPSPYFVNPEASIYGYELLRGRPLLQLLPVHQEVMIALSIRISDLIHQLHSIPRASFPFLREDDSDLFAWWSDSRASYSEIRTEISEKQRPGIDRFFSNFQEFDGLERVFCHNDLGEEHILVDSEMEVTGVIDWSEAAWTDPAHDLGRLARDLGMMFLDLLLQNYHHDLDLPALRLRSAFVAKCTLIEDLHYGLKSSSPLYSLKGFERIDEFFAE